MPRVVIRYCDKLSLGYAITACIMFLYKKDRSDKETVYLRGAGKVIVEFSKANSLYRFDLYKDIDVTDR